MTVLRIVAVTLLGCLPALAADHELTGKVVDAVTGEPVVHARLTVRFFQTGTAEATLLSDADGSFRITNMPGSQFQVTCEKAGYLSTTAGAGQTNVVIRLTPQAALEGTVMDQNDAPAESAFVQLVAQNVMNGRRQFQSSQGGGTDETGHFRLYGLTAGRYYLSILPRLTAAQRTRPLAYPPLYYPNANDIAAAQPIDLKAGEERQIRIKIPEPVTAYEIRGTVATSAPSVGLQLVRQPSLQGYLQSGPESKWDPKTGTFRISHVTTGVYLLTAYVQEGKTPLQATTTVTVSNRNIDGIRLEPAEIVLDGTVRVDGDAWKAGMANYLSLQADGRTNGAQIDAEGKFRVNNLYPDTYRITAQINNPQWCVRSILQGGRDVRDGLTVSPGVAPEPLEIALTSHCGSIDASVTAPESGLPPNVVTMLLRKSGGELVLEKQGYPRARGTDGSRHALMQGVSPGDYVLYAWPQDAQIEYTNAEYMRQFESYGQAVTVTEDGKVSVTIDRLLIPAKE